MGSPIGEAGVIGQGSKPPSSPSPSLLSAEEERGAPCPETLNTSLSLQTPFSDTPPSLPSSSLPLLGLQEASSELRELIFEQRFGPLRKEAEEERQRREEAKKEAFRALLRESGMVNENSR